MGSAFCILSLRLRPVESVRAVIPGGDHSLNVLHTDEDKQLSQREVNPEEVQYLWILTVL